MGVDGPHRTAGHPQDTPRARLPLAAAGSQSALYSRAGHALRSAMEDPMSSLLGFAMGLFKDERSRMNVKVAATHVCASTGGWID